MKKLITLISAVLLASSAMLVEAAPRQVAHHVVKPAHGGKTARVGKTAHPVKAKQLGKTAHLAKASHMKAKPARKVLIAKKAKPGKMLRTHQHR